MSSLLGYRPLPVTPLCNTELLQITRETPNGYAEITELRLLRLQPRRPETLPYLV